MQESRGLAGKSSAYSRSISIPFWISTMVVFPFVTAGAISSAVDGVAPGNDFAHTTTKSQGPRPRSTASETVGTTAAGLTLTSPQNVELMVKPLAFAAAKLERHTAVM